MRLDLQQTVYGNTLEKTFFFGENFGKFMITT